MVARKRPPAKANKLKQVQQAPVKVSAKKAATAKAQEMIQELDCKVRQKCEEILQAGEDAAAAVRNEYSIQLMLIKTDVRRMTLQDFRRSFAADIDPLLLERVDRCLQLGGSCIEAKDVAAACNANGATLLRSSQRRRAPAQMSTAAPTTRRATRSRALATPATRVASTSAAAGTARPARLGEMLVSYETGSPVEVAALRGGPPDVSGMVPGTVVRPADGASSLPVGGGGYATMFVQKRRGGKTKATQGGPGILVTLNDGCQVVVTNREALKMVPEEMQDEVKAQLQQWHNTTASLLQTSPPAGAAHS